MTSPVAEVRNLSKRYGAKPALDGLSFILQPGAWVALLGPNGAGKSTLFQILTGLFSPDTGQVQVTGIDLRAQPAAALRHIGVVFQQSSLDLDLSVARNWRWHADLHGLTTAAAKQRIQQAAQVFGLQADLQRPVRELSGGNRRKVELARALMHRPALLLMDEPTVGLDPKSRRDLLAAIRAYVSTDVNARGTAVLWATHWVEEAEQADRVLVLHKGKLLADGSPAEVIRTLGGSSLEDAFIQSTSVVAKETVAP
jgi:ABC-2 type transport system ATP-binding protein